MTYIATVVIASPIRGFPREPANLMFLWRRLRLRWTRASGHSGLRQDAEQTRLTGAGGSTNSGCPRLSDISVSTNINFPVRTGVARTRRYLHGSELLPRFAQIIKHIAKHAVVAADVSRSARGIFKCELSRMLLHPILRIYMPAISWKNVNFKNISKQRFHFNSKSQRKRDDSLII